MQEFFIQQINTCASGLGPLVYSKRCGFSSQNEGPMISINSGVGTSFSLVTVSPVRGDTEVTGVCRKYTVSVRIYLNEITFRSSSSYLSPDHEGSFFKYGLDVVVIDIVLCEQNLMLVLWKRALNTSDKYESLIGDMYIYLPVIALQLLFLSFPNGQWPKM